VYTEQTYEIERNGLLRLQHHEILKVLEQGIFKVFNIFEETLVDDMLTPQMFRAITQNCRSLVNIPETKRTREDEELTSHQIAALNLEYLSSELSDKEFALQACEEGVARILEKQGELWYLNDIIAEVLHCAKPVVDRVVTEYLRFLVLHEFKADSATLIPCDLV
jgi:hypothetical protein